MPAFGITKFAWVGGALAALLALSAEEAARAYVLPTEAILSAVARRRTQLGVHTLVLEGVLRKSVDDPNPTPIWEVVRPGVGHRMEYRGPGGTQVVLTVGQRRWAFKAGEAPGQPTKVRPELLDVFLIPPEREHEGSRHGMDFLNARGIADDEVTLSRLNSRIAYVIGAKPWELDRPQLWIDKSYRVPIRLIELDPTTKRPIETRLLDLGAPQTGEWFPRRIEIYREGQLVEQITYLRSSVNEPIDDALLRAPVNR